MTEQQEREAFERWFLGDPPPSSHANQRDANGSYMYMAMATAWRVWQARAALPSAPAGEPVAKVVREGDRKCIKFVGLNGLAVDVGTFLYTSPQPAAASDDEPVAWLDAAADDVISATQKLRWERSGRWHLVAEDYKTPLYTRAQAATSDDAQDAARYRKLRLHCTSMDFSTGSVDSSIDGWAHRIDEEVDAAMKKAQK